MKLYNRIWGGRSRTDRFIVALAAVFLVWLVVAFVRSDLDDPQVPTRQAAQKTTPSDAASKAPPCSSVSHQPAAGQRITCRTTNARLQIVAGGTPLLLEDLQIRVLRARLSGDAVQVRLRARNESERARIVNEHHRQVFLRVGGRRVYSTGTGTNLPSGTGANFQLGFTVPGGLVQRLGTAELAVTTFAEADRARPSTLGIIRLRIAPAATPTP